MSEDDYSDKTWITADVKTCPHGYVFKVYCKVCADPATYEAFKRERDEDSQKSSMICFDCSQNLTMDEAEFNKELKIHLDYWSCFRCRFHRES